MATKAWGTVGVSENLIEASWLALVDSISYKLKKEYGARVQQDQAKLSARRKLISYGLIFKNP